MSRPERVTWKPHPRCSKPHELWSAPDDDATEHEVTAFMAALTRLLKPDVVVETGTYHGHTTAAIANALEQNTTGAIWSYETDRPRALAAALALREHIDAGRVNLINAAVTTETCPRPIDLAFLDSGMRTRQDDLTAIWPHLSPGAIVAIHDASPLRPPGMVVPPGDAQRFDIATPRGLLLLQRPW